MGEKVRNWNWVRALADYAYVALACLHSAHPLPTHSSAFFLSFHALGLKHRILASPYFPAKWLPSKESSTKRQPQDTGKIEIERPCTFFFKFCVWQQWITSGLRHYPYLWHSWESHQYVGHLYLPRPLLSSSRQCFAKLETKSRALFILG